LRRITAEGIREARAAYKLWEIMINEAEWERGLAFDFNWL